MIKVLKNQYAQFYAKMLWDLRKLIKMKLKRKARKIKRKLTNSWRNISKKQKLIFILLKNLVLIQT